MTLRGFILWFWGIVIGSGVAAGATLAMLKAPEKAPAAPPASVRPVALADQLPLPPLPVVAPVAAPPAAKPSEARPRATVIRAGRTHRARHPARVAEQRITVVPPIPPQRAAEAESDRAARPTKLANSRRALRREAQRRPAEARPEPGPRALAYARAYRRYSYYTYSFPYSYPHPYRYSYFYRY